MKKAKTEKKKFNYGVGFYWPNSDGAIGLYSYGTDVFHGTLKDAKEFKKYVQGGDPEKEYHIFMLVEVPE